MKVVFQVLTSIICLQAAALLFAQESAQKMSAQKMSAQEVYPLVLAGGRVMDPESGLDAVRDIAVRDGKIARISATRLQGEVKVDVTAQIVAPGFIDLHSHTPTALGQSYQVRDGVTTALELEAGAFPVDRYGQLLSAGSRLNFGASAGYGYLRGEVMLGVRQPHLTDAPEPLGMLGWWTSFRSLFAQVTTANTKIADVAERARLQAMLHEGIDQGGIGIGLLLDYYSEGIDLAEVRGVFAVAGKRSVPVFVHIRRGIDGDPAGLHEVLGLAHETGASLHICHITHSAMSNLELFLNEISKARSAGLDVTTEVLPYAAGSTSIGAAVFARDWRTVFNIDYGDVEWAASGERLTRETFAQYRKAEPGGQVIHHYLDEDWNRRALREPGVMVVSDLLPMFTEERKVAPHNGAFAKVLGRYVREEGVLDLMTGIRKMTLLPAQRLENVAPAFKSKGRVQEGADADLTIFDPAAVIDRATYKDPYQPSAGIQHVIVNGTFVVKDAVLVPDAFPGRRMLGVQ